MVKITSHMSAPSECRQPENRTLLEYWTERCGEKIAPAWSDIHLTELPANIIPWVIVVDVIDEPIDFIYRFWGTVHIRTLGLEMTGRSVRNLLNLEFSRMIFEQYETVWSDRAATLFTYNVESKPHLWRNFETIRLPLSSDGETSDKIISLITPIEQISDTSRPALQSIG